MVKVLRKAYILLLKAKRAWEERRERDREAHLAYMMATKCSPDSSCFRAWTCCSLEWYPSRSRKTHPESLPRLSP